MGALRYGYNTNGLAHHRLGDALALLADCGYDGVALTLDHHHLDPYAPDAAAQAVRLRDRLERLQLGCVVETGARFLLDPRSKHEPTLVSADPAGRARRLDFLRRAADLAKALGAEALSFWAGVPHPGVDRAEAWRWLVDGAGALAAHTDVPLAFEPEPGMLVEDLAGYDLLRAEVPSLRLALDTGHCLVTGGVEPADAVRRYAAALGTVALEDMRRGVHEHLVPGAGDMDFPAVLSALGEVGYDRLVCLELSRDSHRADVLVPRVIQQLRAWA